MKAISAKLPGALLLGLTVLLTSTHRANGQLPSPVGTTWDAIVSGGGQRGIAFLFFEEDRTLSGYQLLAPKPPSKDSFDPRTPYGDYGRTLIGNSPTKTNLYGFGEIRAGMWGYDERGRIVGSYTMLTTEASPAKGPEPYPFTFSGKVVPGKRLTMVTYTPNGKLTYSARPYRSTPALDLSGNWFATKKTGGQTFSEFFPVYPFADTEWLYYTEKTVFYTDDEDGPGYTLDGVVLWSSQKKVAFTFTSTPNPSGVLTNSLPGSGTMYATYGTLSRSGGILKASTTGVQEPYNKVVLNAVWQSALPASEPAK